MNETEVADEVVDRADINDGAVVVEYRATEAALAKLRERFKNVHFDVTARDGNKAARSARLELVTLRTTLEKKRKAFKAPALALGKAIDDEARRITGEILALEAPIDEQILAEEQRLADIKAELERKEAARVAAHEARIKQIRAYVQHAHNRSSEDLAKAAATVSSIELSELLCEEFTERTIAARDDVVSELEAMRAAAEEREEEKTRLEKLRVEQEQIAAEQKRIAAEHARVAAEQSRIAAEQAESTRKLEAERTAIAAERAAAIKAAEEAKAKAAEDAAKASAKSAEPPPSPAKKTKAPQASLTLFQVQDMLGIGIGAELLDDFGFSGPYMADDFSGICDAIIAHINAAKDAHYKAA